MTPLLRTAAASRAPPGSRSARNSPPNLRTQRPTGHIAPLRPPPPLARTFAATATTRHLAAPTAAAPFAVVGGSGGACQITTAVVSESRRTGGGLSWWPRWCCRSGGSSSLQDANKRRVACAADAADAADSDVVEIPADGRILLVGVTGVTGRSALQGMLAVMGPGRTAHTLLALTRNPGGAAARAMPPGVQVVAGDLDDPASLECALRGVTAVYCHALGKDAATADPAELVRARNLAAAARAAGVRLILYNSSGGRGCGYGITQMDQKHRVEDLLAEGVPTIALRASMFMEELWKRYTRPGILRGSFTWSTPSDRPVQLVAARDLGLAAGWLLAGEGPGAAAPQEHQGSGAGSSGSRISVPLDDGAPGRDGEGDGDGQARGPTQKQPQRRRKLRLRAVELSGDELSPQQMCDVFSRVQETPVRHHRAPAWPFWFLARDVYRISRFLTERGFDGDVATCRTQFPGMLTFEDFLRATGWVQPSKSYEDGISFSDSTATPPPAGVAAGATAAKASAAAGQSRD